MTCKWLHAFNLYIYNLYVVVGTCMHLHVILIYITNLHVGTCMSVTHIYFSLNLSGILCIIHLQPLFSEGYSGVHGSVISSTPRILVDLGYRG